MSNHSTINIQQIRDDIARRKAMPEFGPDTCIDRLKIVQETQRSFTPEIVEALLDELKVVTHTAAVDHEAACSLVEENEELKRKQASPMDGPDDYFASLVFAARFRAEKAMRKYPQPNYVLNKVAEESGEVIKAVIHYVEGRETWANVEGELIDNLAMLIRLVTDGDQVIGFTPPESCRTATLLLEIPSGWRWTPNLPDSQE
ncbi:MazG-like family protein [Citrobacter amalonaticus]|uniref:MazG-like family protein n=1 Tax=Citrobacter amalonaticus TaxID=35703 RepID=UPI0023B0B927|nr:MazG-like family protein [Citrobacter amalonaticus]